MDRKALRQHSGPERPHPVAGSLALLFLERLMAAVVLARAVALIGLGLWLAPGGRSYDGPDGPFREAEEK